MRKHNRYLPPALKPTGRLNNSVVSHRRRKRSNAQTHGVFAEPLILPGEDPREFEALHAALIKEWTPSGPSEQSLVYGIADAMWRKRRSQEFVQAKAISNSMRPDHPAFDETRGLISFGYLMCRKPETAFVEYASQYLRADKIRYLNQKFPRQNFESIVEWAVAVAEEIKSDLLPGTPGFAALDPDRLDPATEALRTDIIKMHSFITTIHMREFLDDDLEQQERLDKRIARLIDDLIETKTRKQVLRQTSVDDKTNNRGHKGRS
ncbi:MAG TPA: hypothetical protein VFN27_03715 [Xanthobacteraceae bacterium]|nr:hypothetical protein [Xanthobacteraceae bacterium]